MGVFQKEKKVLERYTVGWKHISIVLDINRVKLSYMWYNNSMLQNSKLLQKLL